MGRLITSNLNNEFTNALNGIPMSDGARNNMKRSAGGSVDLMTQQYFNPFWEMSTMEVPKDRRKINAWCRYFFDSEPIVRAALTLHTEFPLSDIYVEHEDPAIQALCQEMIDRAEIFDFLMDAVLEYWTVGEFFPFGILDDPDNPTMWDKFICLDPDYVDVFSLPMAHGLASKRINKLPDPITKRIVANGPNDPNTGEIYRNMPEDVIYYVMRDEPMPLDPICASHVKSMGNVHNERGTPLLLACFKLLMYREKLREAQYAIADRHVTPKEFYMIGEAGEPADQEELNSFKDALEASWTQPNQAIVWHHALRIQWEGACHDDQTECLTRDGFKYYNELSLNDEIATLNQGTGIIEYHNPEAIHIYDYDGDMYHFSTDNKVDTMVTPNHRMLVSRRKRANGVRKYADYEIIRADELRGDYKFRVGAEWHGTKLDCDTIDIGNLSITIGQYLRLGGYFASEGSSYFRSDTDGRFYISQNENTRVLDDMRTLMSDTKIPHFEYVSSPNKVGNRCVRLICSDTDLTRKLADDFGHLWHKKCVPQWIKNLPPRYIQIFLDAVCDGDGCDHRGSGYWTYWTTSVKLADDIQELAWKCGYAPTIKPYTPEQKGGFDNRRDCYAVYWTTKNDIGKYPHVNSGDINITKYNGKVWCVTVPNGLFVTRRNGKLAIHGNSGRILPLNAEFDNIEKNILAGMLMSRGFIDGTGPGFSATSVAMDVLINRYLFLRKKVEQWLKVHFFGPILRIHNVYKPVDSELLGRYRVSGRDRVPWYPEIHWSKANLRDDLQKIQLMQALYDKGLIPASTVLKSVGINPKVAIEGIEKEKGTVFDKAMKIPGGGPVPPGPDMPMLPSDGGMGLPEAGFGPEDMGEMPIESMPEGLPPEATSNVNLPNTM